MIIYQQNEDTIWFKENTLMFCIGEGFTHHRMVIDSTKTEPRTIYMFQEFNVRTELDQKFYNRVYRSRE
jgi:hypothetical protein